MEIPEKRGMKKGARSPARALEQRTEGQLRRCSHFQKRHFILSMIQRFNYVVPELRVGVTTIEPDPEKPEDNGQHAA